MSKRRFPAEMEFHFSGFDWRIVFLDIEASDFGETDTDKKEVRIYYKNRSDQNVIETLIHELEHVIMFELADPVFRFEADRPHDMEENLVRLTSPRTFDLLRNNIKLMDFIVKRIKGLNEGK